MRTRDRRASIGAMQTTTLLAALLSTSIIAVPTVAMAGGQASTLGIGAEYLLGSAGDAGGLGGLSASYDTGKLHVGGYVQLTDSAGTDNTSFGLGGRFYYHVASRINSDFGIGGGLGFLNVQVPGPTDTLNLIVLEPGFQIRTFLTDNVAVSFNAGISIGLGDADGFSLTGNTVGGAGLHYYFF